MIKKMAAAPDASVKLTSTSRYQTAKIETAATQPVYHKSARTTVFEDRTPKVNNLKEPVKTKPLTETFHYRPGTFQKESEAAPEFVSKSSGSGVATIVPGRPLMFAHVVYPPMSAAPRVR